MGALYTMEYIDLRGASFVTSGIIFFLVTLLFGNMNVASIHRQAPIVPRSADYFFRCNIVSDHVGIDKFKL